MKAPEKIYIDANEDWHRTYTAFTEKAKGNDIEYTRTDAFIEKAVNYLEGTLFNKVCYGEIRPDIVQAYINDFKNAMKL